MKKSVALVLSSGGARGLAHIGVINKLKKHGFNITSVSGSSMGSVIGGLYAMNKLDDYAQWITSLDKKGVWDILDFTFSKTALIKGERVFDKMKTFIPDMNIEEMHTPFVAVATDLLHQKAIIFNKGSFYKAARASVAIPGVVTPFEHQETLLVDGGVLNPVPIEQVLRQKNDLLVVVNLYGNKREKQLNSIINEKKKHSYLETLKHRLLNLSLSNHKKNKNFFSLMSCTSSAMLSRIAQLSIEKHQPDITITIPQDYAHTFEFYKAKDIIQYGETVAQKAIDQYLRSEELQSL